MFNILVVSIAAPPKSDPESLQVGRYLKYLSKCDCNLQLLTSRNPTLYMETDDELKKYLADVKKVTEVRLIENRYTNFLLRKAFPRLLELPDSKWSFHRSTVTPKEIPDIIYSRSYPLSSTLMALKLKKKWGIPWVLHLSDPWALSFDGDSPATNFGESSRQWNAKKERECFTLADRISFTSKKTIDLYVSKYPEHQHKFLLTPNVYDDDLLSNQQLDFSGKLKVVYTGGFGEKRSPTFYLNAIQKFLERNETFRDRVEFLFTGPMTRENHRKFQDFDHLPEVIHLGSIPYQEMLELQRSSHVLVNIDTNISDAQHSVFFPSKLLEYMAANRRILAITNSHSVTHDVVQGKSGDCVEFNDEKCLTDLLEHYWEKFNCKDDTFFSLKREIESYGAKVNATKLFEVLQAVIK